MRLPRHSPSAGIISPMPLPTISHLHTYFLFPFSIDKEAVLADHQALWAKHSDWIDGLDEWIASHPQKGPSAVVERIGPWRRSAYKRFDMDSAAYQDMVFFHPFVRRIFFDTAESCGSAGEVEAMLRCYTIAIPESAQLHFLARDARGRSARLQVTDLRLFLFANGIGILSIGVEAWGLPADEALWANEMMRKVYPSSGRQVREGRVPNYLAFVIERDGSEQVVVEETFSTGSMLGFLPPLARTISGLLYFADYARQEFEPVLDERMIVHTFVDIDETSAGPDYLSSEEYQVLLSRLLYVDRWGTTRRYDSDFIRREMRRQVYTRWAHEGTYYGFTSYSSITTAIGERDRDEHLAQEGFLIHRMFTTRYYLMAMVALFYRATLLDFAERTALVSRALYFAQHIGRASNEQIRMAGALRSDFLHFSNYWHFAELANKDEEIEHFGMQCREYRISSMKREIEEEIEKLNVSLDTYYQFRNTEAVNRLAMLSLIFGAGAVLTGFFGMNFGGRFGRLFFEPDSASQPVHWIAVMMVTLLAFGALLLGIFLVVANWADYRDSLTPRRRHEAAAQSLRRVKLPDSE